MHLEGENEMLHVIALHLIALRQSLTEPEAYCWWWVFCLFVCLIKLMFSKLLGSSHLYTAGSSGFCSHIWNFIWVLRIQSQVPVLTEKVYLLTEPSPSSPCDKVYENIYFLGRVKTYV